MGGHSVGEPDEIGLGPDGTTPSWPPVPPENQQPMPPCHRCGTPFAAHVDGRCPPTGATAESVTAPHWAAGFRGAAPPYAYWAPPLGGPPHVPAMAAPRPPWQNWPRRHPLLTGAITLMVLLLSVGIVHEVGQAASQTTGLATSQTANGNATACSDYWSMTSSVDWADFGSAAEGWQDLQAAEPGITDPALSNAVQVFDNILTNPDTVDAETAAIYIAKACTALGYGDPD